MYFFENFFLQYRIFQFVWEMVFFAVYDFRCGRVCFGNMLFFAVYLFFWKHFFCRIGFFLAVFGGSGFYFFWWNFFPVFFPCKKSVEVPFFSVQTFLRVINARRGDKTIGLVIFQIEKIIPFNYASAYVFSSACVRAISKSIHYFFISKT